MEGIHCFLHSDNITGWGISIEVKKDGKGYPHQYRESVLQFFSISTKVAFKVEKAMATHSSTFAWKIPWMEEPGRLQSMGLLRVRHDWATSLSLFTFMHWRRKWQPTPAFLPGESQGWGSLVAAVYGVTQSRTWLKWLSIHQTLWHELPDTQ